MSAMNGKIRKGMVLIAMFLSINAGAAAAENDELYFLYADGSGRIQGETAERLAKHVKNSFYHAQLKRTDVDLLDYDTVAEVYRHVASATNGAHVLGVLLITDAAAAETGRLVNSQGMHETVPGVKVDTDGRMAVVNLNAYQLDEVDDETAARRMERLVLHAAARLLGLDACPLHRCVLYGGLMPDTVDNVGRNLCPPHFNLAENALLSDHEH